MEKVCLFEVKKRLLIRLHDITLHFSEFFSVAALKTRDPIYHCRGTEITFKLKILQ